MFGYMNQWLHEQLEAVRSLPSSNPKDYHLSVNAQATHGTLFRLLEEVKSRIEGDDTSFDVGEGEESWLNLEYKGGANGSSATDYESCITGVLNPPPPPPAMAPPPPRHDDQHEEGEDEEREDEESEDEEGEDEECDHNDVCGW